jgi:hypothetical protein
MRDEGRAFGREVVAVQGALLWWDGVGPCMMLEVRAMVVQA